MRIWLSGSKQNSVTNRAQTQSVHQGFKWSLFPLSRVLAVVPVADVCSPSEVGKFLSRKETFSLQGKTPRDKVALKLPDDCMTIENSSGHKVTLTNGVAHKVAQHLPRDLRRYPSVNDKPGQQCPSASASRADCVFPLPWTGGCCMATRLQRAFGHNYSMFLHSQSNGGRIFISGGAPNVQLPRITVSSPEMAAAAPWKQPRRVPFWSDSRSYRHQRGHEVFSEGCLLIFSAVKWYYMAFPTPNPIKWQNYLIALIK